MLSLSELNGCMRPVVTVNSTDNHNAILRRAIENSRSFTDSEGVEGNDLAKSMDSAGPL